MKPIDINRMGVSLLPTCLRRPVVCAILRAALAPIAELESRIYTRHETSPYGTYYNLRHDGQVCILEALLNDRHDPADRRIYIGERPKKPLLYIYTPGEIEAQPELARWTYRRSEGQDPIYVYHPSELQTARSSDFVVFVPSALSPAEPDIRASIEDFRIAGVAYLLEYY